MNWKAHRFTYSMFSLIAAFLVLFSMISVNPATSIAEENGETTPTAPSPDPGASGDGWELLQDALPTYSPNQNFVWNRGCYTYDPDEGIYQDDFLKAPANLGSWNKYTRCDFANNTSMVLPVHDPELEKQGKVRLRVVYNQTAINRPGQQASYTSNPWFNFAISKGWTFAQPVRVRVYSGYDGFSENSTAIADQSYELKTSCNYGDLPCRDKAGNWMGMTWNYANPLTHDADSEQLRHFIYLNTKMNNGFNESWCDSYNLPRTSPGCYALYWRHIASADKSSGYGEFDRAPGKNFTLPKDIAEQYNWNFQETDYGWGRKDSQAAKIGKDIGEFFAFNYWTSNSEGGKFITLDVVLERDKQNFPDGSADSTFSPGKAPFVMAGYRSADRGEHYGRGNFLFRDTNPTRKELRLRVKETLRDDGGRTADKYPIPRHDLKIKVDVDSETYRKPVQPDQGFGGCRKPDHLERKYKYFTYANVDYTTNHFSVSLIDPDAPQGQGEIKLEQHFDYLDPNTGFKIYHFAGNYKGYAVVIKPEKYGIYDTPSEESTWLVDWYPKDNSQVEPMLSKITVNMGKNKEISPTKPNGPEGVHLFGVSDTNDARPLLTYYDQFGKPMPATSKQLVEDKTTGKAEWKEMPNTASMKLNYTAGTFTPTADGKGGSRPAIKPGVTFEPKKAANGKTLDPIVSEYPGVLDEKGVLVSKHPIPTDPNNPDQPLASATKQVGEYQVTPGTFNHSAIPDKCVKIEAAKTSDNDIYWVLDGGARLKVEKTGADGKPLKGAKFALYQNQKNGADADGIGKIVEELPNFTNPDGVIDEGKFLSKTKLKPNEIYWLVETQAPVGHLLAQPVKLKVTEKGLEIIDAAKNPNITVKAIDDKNPDIRTIQFIDQKAPTLPHTGSIAIYLYPLLGCMLMAFAYWMLRPHGAKVKSC